MLPFTSLPQREEERAVQESNPHLESFEAIRFYSVKLTALKEVLEWTAGIEPASPAWHAGTLDRLSYAH